MSFKYLHWLDSYGLHRQIGILQTMTTMMAGVTVITLIHVMCIPFKFFRDVDELLLNRPVS